MSVTKNDLINETAILCGVTREHVKNSVEQFFDVVKDTIKAGKSLEIRGFGTFSPKTCNPRAGRNLKTGELIPLALSKSVSLRYSSKLKAKITGSAPKLAVAKKQVQVRELAKIGSF